MEVWKGKDRGQKNTAHNNTISFVSNVQDWKKRIHHNAQDCLSPSRNGFWQENKSLGLFNTFYIFFISVLIEKPN